MNFSEFSIEMAERGLVPDVLLRAGIRKLLRGRLKAITSGHCETDQETTNRLIEQFSNGPIAPVPEKANEQHYEVGAGVFEKMLGRRFKYSCCCWPAGINSLDQAEEAALKITCERAGIEDGMRILELGCGWGSLSLWMAENFPNSEITAVSNSNSQREFIINRAKEWGIANRLNVITCDMNDFHTDDVFERVVSVEMFEHMRNYRELLARVSNWLVDDGKLFVHIFCHREFTYEFHDQTSDDWMSRYFFSGGVMPSDDLFLRFPKHLQVDQQWRWSGIHYQKTSDAWLANMDLHRNELLGEFSKEYSQPEAVRWFNRWRMFYLACSELFGYQQGNQWWVSHYLFSKLQLESEQNGQARLDHNKKIPVTSSC
ncbi:MAG: cyclopropane-fatty-acyl-phospholipid synthase family protein [Planctomycetota bacterium]